MSFPDSALKKWQRNGILFYECVGEKYELLIDFWKDLHNYDILKNATSMACPVKIIHGDADTILAISQSISLAKAFGIGVHVVKGAEHNYAEAAQYLDMKKTTLDFLKRKLLLK